MISRINIPKVVRVYADNGEHSHYKLIDIKTGETLWEEAEPIKPVCPECGHDVNYSRETYPHEDTESIPDDPKWRVCAKCHQEWFTDIEYSTGKEVSNE